MYQTNNTIKCSVINEGKLWLTHNRYRIVYRFGHAKRIEYVGIYASHVGIRASITQVLYAVQHYHWYGVRQKQFRAETIGNWPVEISLLRHPESTTTYSL